MWYDKKIVRILEGVHRYRIENSVSAGFLAGENLPLRHCTVLL